MNFRLVTFILLAHLFIACQADQSDEAGDECVGANVLDFEARLIDARINRKAEVFQKFEKLQAAMGDYREAYIQFSNNNHLIFNYDSTVRESIAVDFLTRAASGSSFDSGNFRFISENFSNIDGATKNYDGFSAITSAAFYCNASAFDELIQYTSGRERDEITCYKNWRCDELGVR